MELGEIFLILACVLLLFDFILLLRVKAKAEEKNKREIAFFVATIACVLVMGSCFRLVMAFLNDTFALWEVYAYSSSSLAVLYKFGDIWIGGSGSMLFVTALIALVYLAYRFKGFGKESVFHTTTYQILDLFLIFYIIATLLKSPFELLPVIPPEGAGLNPLLQTFWVTIHPPVIFLGYVFVFFAFALTLAGMITGEQGERDRKTLRLSLYAAWLFLSLGIALGGWWSYEVLGWGGYWAWDPVETASLLPWFALTAYFHLPVRSKDMAKELTLMITFFMVIFATALTRGGLLESVHAFGDSPLGPAFLIFAFFVLIFFFYLSLGMITQKRVIRVLTVLIGAVLPFIFAYLKLQGALSLFDIVLIYLMLPGVYLPLILFLYIFLIDLDVDLSSVRSISLLLGFCSLIFLLLVCYFGVLAPIIGGLFSDNPMTTSAEFYNKWCYPFTLAFVAALMGCNTNLKLEKYTGIIIATLGIGAVLALLGLPTPDPLANIGLPLLIVAGVAIVYNFARLLSKKNSSRLWGKTIVHFAIIVILIGVFVSSSMAEESDNLFATSESTIEALGATIVVNGFTVYPGTGSVYFPQHNIILPEYSALKIDVTINERGSVYREPLWLYYYPNHGAVSEPLIISTLRGDLYVYMQHTDSSFDSLRFALMGEEIQPESVVLRVKKNPLIGFVWVGIVLMGLGMTILLIGELLRRDRKERS